MPVEGGGLDLGPGGLMGSVRRRGGKPAPRPPLLNTTLEQTLKFLSPPMAPVLEMLIGGSSPSVNYRAAAAAPPPSWPPLCPSVACCTPRLLFKKGWGGHRKIKLGIMERARRSCGAEGPQPAPSGKLRSGSREHTGGSASAGGRTRGGQRTRRGDHGALAKKERPVNAPRFLIFFFYTFPRNV